MHLGIDFDNTLIDHGRSIWIAARELGLVPEGFPEDKKRIRDHIRSASGNDAWIRVQSVAYGPGMVHARLHPGAREFLAHCADRRVRVAVVSHKSSRSAIGDIDLHGFATRYLEESGLFDGRPPLLARDSVHFEPTRSAKVERIRTLGCTHFVDDLEETFLEAGFPEIDRFLFSPGPVSGPTEPDGIGWTRISHWDQLPELLFR